jgi:hypothetical protein
MTAFCNSHRTTSNTNKIVHNTRIAKAIANLKTQDRPNIAATAKKYRVARCEEIS